MSAHRPPPRYERAAYTYPRATRFRFACSVRRGLFETAETAASIAARRRRTRHPGTQAARSRRARTSLMIASAA